jgi:hypothetical protein
MAIVSRNTVSVSLNKNLDCNDLCGKIQNLINNYSKQNPQLHDTLLRIEVVPINDSIECLLPKLEFKK